MVAVAAAGGHPLAPLVVGEDGSGDDQKGDNGEQDLHHRFQVQVSGFGAALRSQFIVYAERGREGPANPYEILTPGTGC